MTKTHNRKIRRISSSFVSTIPKEIVKELGIKKGDSIVWTVHNKKLTLTHVPQGITEDEQLEQVKKAIKRMSKSASEKNKSEEDEVDDLPKSYALERLRIK